MGKIGDIWVKLGLKSDDFKKGVADAKQETEGFGSKLKSMSLAAKAAWAAVGAAVIKVGKDFINASQKVGDQWAIAMEGMKAGYGAFIRGLSSGEGFDELFTNIQTAIQLAREAAASLDEIFERRISFSYQEAATENEIAKLQLVLRDSSKSDAERKSAAEQIIAKYKELAAIKQDINRQEAAAQRDLFRAQTQMNDEQIDYMLKYYNENRNVINESRAYLEERSRLEKELANVKASYGFGAMSDKAYSSIQKRIDDANNGLASLEANTSAAIKSVAKLTQQYDKSNDALVENMARADIAIIQADTEASRASMRATAMLGSLNKSQSSTDDSELKAVLAQKRAIEDSYKSQTQLLKEKLEADKALWEKYGLDTLPLVQKYYEDLDAVVNEGLNKALEKTLSIEPIDIELFDMSEIDRQLDEFEGSINNLLGRTQQIAHEFSGAITGGFANACQELMDSLMGLQEMNSGAVVQALLEPLADMAVKAGSIIMAEGLATVAANSALATFGVTGWGAVAAGAALVAAGTAAKAGLAALAKSTAPSSVGTGATSSSGSSTTKNIDSSLTIYVTGRISGGDILISGERTSAAWSR